MTPNYSAVLDFDYQLRRHVRKRNRAMFEKNIFHFSDFFLDKIDVAVETIVGRNPSRRGASKRITRCDSLTSTYDHSRNIALFLIKLTIHQI